MSFRAVYRGCGAFLPAQIVTNADLAQKVDTSDEWIVERTGIRERRIAGDKETTSDHGAAAAAHAHPDADMRPEDIDLIVVATSTPDLTFPATAALIQAKLGIKNGAAFDIQAVCSGFVYAVSTAEKFLLSGQHQRALVIGAETFSRILDWNDRSTCVLFGDGAGAFVLEAVETEKAGDAGVLASALFCDGALSELLYVDGGVSSTGTIGHLRMEGNKVFREAVTRISQAMRDVADKAGVAPENIDWFVPHQANQRIIDGVARKLRLRPEQVISTIAQHANTSAASIPLAFSTGVADGRIKPGDLVMIEAMGGGMTWGAALLRV
ncbi:MAG: beta-ketoacyl-ACP synthase III [Pseudomonadota bacterium]